MNSWCWSGVLLFFCSSVPLTIHAESAAEFREIKLTDGSVYRGIVIGSDAENLTIRTIEGEQTCSLFDIVQIQALSREAFLINAGGIALYLPVSSAPDQTDVGDSLDKIMLEALRRDMLEFVPVSLLPETVQASLANCTDLACRKEIARNLNYRLLQRELDETTQGLETTFRWFDHEMKEQSHVSWMIFDPKGQQSELILLAGEILGEHEGPPRPQAMPEDKTGHSGSGTRTDAPPPLADELSPDTVDLGLSAARKLDLVPVPGLASTIYFDNIPATVASCGAVAVATGLTVYFFGDIRKLGFDEGLGVPWTYEHRDVGNAVALTGVGITTYLATTWIANQIVRRLNVKKAGARTGNVSSRHGRPRHPPAL